MNTLERLEELQKLYNAYLDEGDAQEAYWVSIDIQELLMDDLEQRYTAVMNRLSVPTLLELPESIKNILKDVTDLQTKVEILESVADRLNR